MAKVKRRNPIKNMVNKVENERDDVNSDRDGTEDSAQDNDDSGLNLDNDILSDGGSEEGRLDEILEERGEKRKFDEDGNSGPHKKRSRHKTKDVKPPTAEEMLALRETENLFQSNLFRLQIEEMLSELKPKKSVKRLIGPWIENLIKILTSLEKSEPVDLSEANWASTFNLQIPMRFKKPEKGKGAFGFKPPVEVFPVGSHSLGCPLGPFYTVDIAVVMPKVFILHNDNLNQRYHLKRTLYLCYIADKLRDHELLSTEHKLQFKFMSDDSRKPLLLLRPAGKLAKFITVCLHSIPEDKSFKFKRLLPSKNNLRPVWWGLSKDILPPTPSYNASILEDVVFKQNHLFKKEIFDQNHCLKDAFVLMRVWLKQRGLSEGFGGFNSHLLSMLLVYLCKINKINKHMSSYQITRHAWLYLADSDWTENGISLCEIKQEEAPSIEEFHIYYELVFIDVTGYFNIAAALNKFTYLKVKEESKLATQLLDGHEIKGFRALFMIKMPFIRQYDIVVSFNNFPALASTIKGKGDEVNLMDQAMNIIPEFLRLVTELLEKGIGHRLTSIGIKQPIEGSWDIDSRIPPFGSLEIGLNLNVSTALSLIDKGPEPNDPAAEDFREFWGNKCDLRRYKDNTICESVEWEHKNRSIERRRSITHDIILYLLKTKLGKELSFHITSKSFHEFLHPTITKSPSFNREETCKKIILAYEDLSRQLRDLKDLPLDIVSVHCISPVYRFTEPFPPIQPLYHKNISPLFNDPIKGRLFSNDGKVGKFPPEYIPPIDCVLQMAITRNWPDDVNAGKRLIAAFYIAITAALKKNCNLSCQITTDYFVVNKNGYLFRLFLGYAKEIALLKLKISEGVRQYRDTPESLALEKKFVNLPKMTGALYRLSEEYPGFSSAICLTKRWFSSQLFDETHFPVILIELFMAYIFINPQPYSPPLTTLPSFLRFLAFISITDWSTTPVIVNFNSILTKEEIKEIENDFRSDRSSFPPLFLATPYDRTGSLWSKSVPTLSTLVRLAKLAAASLQIIESSIIDRSKAYNILKVFQPPMGVYDAVIKLHPAFQLRKAENLCYNGPHPIENRIPERNSVLPILEFNPVDLFLRDLRDNYGSFALFFHDPCGGLEIGVLFNPSFCENLPHQSAMKNARKPVIENDNVLLKPHYDSIFEGFKIIGNGIVKSIELKKLKEKSVESVICD